MWVVRPPTAYVNTQSLERWLIGGGVLTGQNLRDTTVETLQPIRPCSLISSMGHC